MRIIALLFVALFLSHVSAISQEAIPSINQVLKENTLPDSIKLRLIENISLIDSLKKANFELTEELKKAQSDIERQKQEIANNKYWENDRQNRHREEMRLLEAKNDTLQRHLINVASNFMYIPYEEYSIYKIAIPSFLALKGTQRYDKYRNRLAILQNYKEDIHSLIDFISLSTKGLTEYPKFPPLKADKAKEFLDALHNLPLYARYTDYDDWGNTYLGSQIQLVEKSLEKILKEYTDLTITDLTINELNTIQSKLEDILTNQ